MRVRFAPSPTGYLHIGNARTALFNYLLARKGGGTFILRVEDTDMERSRKEYEEAILDDMRWLGLDWDEGLEEQGSFGPYRQSERQDIYDRITSELMAKGKAYKCYCSDTELEDMRKKQLACGKPPIYTGKCRNILSTEVSARGLQGQSYTVRFRVDPGQVEFDDMVKGRVSFDSGRIGDFIIRRSDGTASFNFANTLDDVMMEITHVIRGEDHLSNTPRQVMIAEAIGAESPIFAHLPLIVGEDRTPLSKRHGDVSLRSFREKGFLKEAMINYLAQLGLSYGEGRDILSLDELIQGFSLERISGSPSVFDIQRLIWINSHYMRNLAQADLKNRLDPFMTTVFHGSSLRSDEWLTACIDEVKGESHTLIDLVDNMRIFSEDPHADVEAAEVLQAETSREVIQAFADRFRIQPVITHEIYREISDDIKSCTGNKGRALFMPIRAVLTGRTKGPAIENLLVLLGRDEVMRRLNNYLDKTK